MPSPDIAGLRALADRIATLDPIKFDWGCSNRPYFFPHEPPTCLCICGWAMLWANYTPPPEKFYDTMADYMVERYHIPYLAACAIVYGDGFGTLEHINIYRYPLPAKAAQRIREVCDLLTTG